MLHPEPHIHKPHEARRRADKVAAHWKRIVEVLAEAAQQKRVIQNWRRVVFVHLLKTEEAEGAACTRASEASAKAAADAKLKAMRAEIDAAAMRAEAEAFAMRAAAMAEAASEAKDKADRAAKDAESTLNRAKGEAAGRLFNALAEASLAQKRLSEDARVEKALATIGPHVRKKKVHRPKAAAVADEATSAALLSPPDAAELRPSRQERISRKKASKLLLEHSTSQQKAEHSTGPSPEYEAHDESFDMDEQPAELAAGPGVAEVVAEAAAAWEGNELTDEVDAGTFEVTICDEAQARAHPEPPIDFTSLESAGGAAEDVSFQFAASQAADPPASAPPRGSSAHSIRTASMQAAVEYEAEEIVVEEGPVEDDFGPTKSEGSRGKNSILLTACIIIADVVGAGILVLPVAFARFGWAIGSVVMLIILGANVHISKLLFRVRMSSQACRSAKTYSDLAFGAFAHAPVWQQNAMTLATGSLQQIFLLGILGLYVLGSGRGLAMLFYDSELCMPVATVFAAIIFLPFACASRALDSCSCKVMVFVQIIAMILAIFIPLCYYMHEGTHDVRTASAKVKPVENETTAWSVISGLSAYSFAFAGQAMMVEIMAEMHLPEDFPIAHTVFSMPFQALMFLLSGALGYVFLGNGASGMIIENLPFNATFRAAAAFLIIHMLGSYVVKGVIVCKFWHNVLDPRHHESGSLSARYFGGWCALAFIVLGAAWVFSNLVPFFGNLVDFLGAFLTPLVCWIIPIVMFWRYHKDAEDKPYLSSIELLVICLEVAFAVLLMTFGTVSAVWAIVDDWANLGAPFECHCYGNWATCECSAHHAGMSCAHHL